MKRRRVAIVITVVAVAVCALPLARRVWAQNAVEKRFDQLDKNSDGKITPDELPAAEFFKRLDLDGNGEITKPEAARALARGAFNDVLKPAPTTPAPTDPTPMEAPVRQGPQPVRPGDHGIGHFVPDVSYVDLAGKTYKVGELAKASTTVFAMTSTSCPLSKKYLPTLVELVKSSGDGIAWVLVNPMATDKPAEMQAAASQFNGKAIYVHDQDGQLASSLGALTTTDVVVLDASRTIVYHGAIDDQYGFGYSIEAPRYRYLADALAAMKAGKQPLVSATEAPGCTLEQPADGVRSVDVTYHNRISRIMQRHCVECHREGGVGPFALDTYDDLVAHAGMVKQVVERGIMPPWFAVEPQRDSKLQAVHTPWANDRSLAEAEKKDLLAWIASGKPEGDRRDAPQPLKFEEGWLIGKPDAIFQFAKPVPIKATGVMPYQNIVVETNLPEDKWVQAIEVQPGDRGVVHHVLVFVQGNDNLDEEPVDDAAAERGGFWGIYVPGNSTLVYPEGFAKRIPKGAKLKFQMHYTPNGTATTDQTRIGLIWAKEPPLHEVRVAGIVNARISIPPGADNHREEATLRLPLDATIMGFLPHLHVRGKACKYEVTRSDGQTTTLLDIPRYDFNWQLLYRYFEPLTLKAGDTLRFTAWFDNSDKNPANPDPTKTVRWGAQTFDEMHLGYVEYYVPGAKPGESTSLYGGRRGFGRNLGSEGNGRPGFGLEAIFKRLDRNSDGKLIGDEIPAAQRDNLLRLDTNQDGAITLEEAKRLRR
ncbi:MAG: redoxin family protein [Planctomycetaceae bacterium]|nr:redoxin family protein [Planctomycetales bacterium]MCB9925840.1 redoxin family protein [Planctomycetaceae bacterium]